MGKYSSSARQERAGSRGTAIAVAVASALALALAPTAAWAAPTPDQGPTVGGTTVTDTVSGVRFTAVAADLAPSYALGDDGKVYAWGPNAPGSLGDGTTTERLTPVRSLTPAGATMTQVSAGEGYALALDSSGIAFGWGQGPYGQLGNGATQDQSTPVAVQAPAPGVSFTQVDAGAYHSLAIGSDGRTYGWGYNGSGRVGDGSTTSIMTTPVVVQTPAGVSFTKVEAGGVFSLGLATDGSIYAWGNNFSGALGNGTQLDSSVPVRVQTPPGVTFTQISAGTDHSLALSSTGVLYAWGFNGGGQVGLGVLTPAVTVPVVVPLPAGVTVASISAGSISTLLDTAGRLYTWGQNSYGALGDGTSADHYSPSPVLMPDGVTVTSMDAGITHVLAIGSDGNTYAWGRNQGGMLGDGTTEQRNAPVRVLMAPTVTSVTFDGIPGTDLAQTDDVWSVVTPAYCGPSDVVVEYTQFGTPASATFANGFTFGTAPSVTQQPVGSTIVSGASAALSAAATGDDAPAVRWQQAPGADGPWSDIPGATGAALDVAPTANTSYRAVFTNCNGEVISDAVVVTVREPSSPEPGNGSGTALTGGTNQPPSADATLAITGGSAAWTAAAVGGGLLILGAAAMLLRRRILS